MRAVPISLLAIWLGLLAVPLAQEEDERAAEAPPAEDAVQLSAEEEAFFEKNIRPLLVDRCYECHSSKLSKPEGSLLLDSRAGVLRGGTRGPAIVPGAPEESLLVHAVKRTNKDLLMPPPPDHDRLPDREIDLLVEWIEMGAPDPRTQSGPLPELAENDYDWAKEAKHWAYQPVQDPRPPADVSAEWRQTAVDRFIRAKLDEQGLTPVERADKRTLIRRATYDLIGLPPTPEEIRAFLNDESPNAFEKMIDRLLASRQYGERWGRHWMDVVRYADTAGDNSDFPIPSSYRYRNYIIESFNEDKPYNQFLREQLAGDLLPPKDAATRQEQIIATGYLANARRFASQPEEFHLTLDDTIKNLGEGILGLTLECARCHDHKYDPIPDEDYYALYGIFKSSKYAMPGIEVEPRPTNFVALGGPKEQERLERCQSQLDELFEEQRDLRRALKGRRDEAPVSGAERAKTAFELYEVEQRLEEVTEEYLEIEKVYAVTEGDEPGNARMLTLGDPEMPGKEVPRGFLTILGGQQLPDEHEGSGRRQLAEWITDPANPLVARVMVNRIWAWHFGRGIVATPNDFGSRGEPPSHPELLDYLTSRFIEQGWSIKRMHKLIMLTRAYQAASAHDAASARQDAENAFLWRFSPRRLSAEEIRDTLLTLSGNLDTSPGGAHPFPPDNDYAYTQHEPFTGVHDEPERYGTNRRSVYLLQQRLRSHPFLDLWNGADPNTATAGREESATPIHALYMMNGPFVHEQADDLAVRIYMAHASDAERLRYAYELLFARPPTAEEIGDAEEYLEKSQQHMPRLVWAASRDDAERLDSAVAAERVRREAWASLMRVLLSSNELITLGDVPHEQGWRPWLTDLLPRPDTWRLDVQMLLLAFVGTVTGLAFATRRLFVARDDNHRRT